MTETDKQLLQESIIEGCKACDIIITDEHLNQFAIYADQLQIWNSKINLTAIKDPKQVAEKHFIDCLSILPYLKDCHHLMDMGTGGGFPGIVIKIMHPSINILLVDSVRKKINFLNHIIRTLGLNGITAVHARAQDLQSDTMYAGQFDGVISRAFADLDLFVDLATPFLNKKGVLYAMKGKEGVHEAGASVLEKFKVSSHFYQLPFEKSHRSLIQLKPTI